MLPRQLEYRAINYVYTGHWYVYVPDFTVLLPENLGRKNRKFVAYCDICRVKHPNRAYEIEKLSHLSTKPGERETISA
jgi:hypothetical protein